MNGPCPTFQRTIGLRGPAVVEINIALPNPFEITAEERKLVFAIVDAVRQFELYAELCAKARGGAA